MRITWLKTASLLLENDSFTLAVDPFLGIPYTDAAEKMKAFRSADAVLVTHGHFDHIYHIPRIYRDHPVPVYCTKTPAVSLIKDGYPEEMIHVISPHDVLPFSGMKITCLPSKHCKFDRDLIVAKLTGLNNAKLAGQMFALLKLNKAYPENEEILLYDIEADGKRIQLMGSMNLLDEDYPEGADLLILPFQGRSDIDSFGEKIIRRLKPKTVLLDHYDDAFPPMSGTVETASFEALLNDRYGIPCRAMTFLKTERTEDL